MAFSATARDEPAAQQGEIERTSGAVQGRRLVGNEVAVVCGREVQLHVCTAMSVPASAQCGGGATIEGVALGEVGVVSARQEAGAVAADLGLEEAAATI